MKLLNKIYERVWMMLPDRCREPDCPRTGVRGNENVVGDRLMCDYCVYSALQLTRISLLEDFSKG